MLRLNGTIRICKGGDAQKSDDGQYYRYKGVSLHPTKPELNQFITFFDYGIGDKRAKLVKEGAILEIIGTFTASVLTNQETKETSVNISCNVQIRDIILFAPKEVEEAKK